jgi:hypothetical protein
MTIVMCITWVVLFVLTALAFWEGKIFQSAPEEVRRDQLRLRFTEQTRVKDVEMAERTASPDPMSMPQSETQTLNDVPVTIHQQTVEVQIESSRAI